ncbi:MAG: helix-turn-helix domain-containing protein [Bacteroidales bacterium]|jgi:AraC-like DNA-binding protein|nr:helix-turn-helix domain-containing protein [Bacteroidales bacterium]
MIFIKFRFIIIFILFFLSINISFSQNKDKTDYADVDYFYLQLERNISSSFEKQKKLELKNASLDSLIQNYIEKGGYLGIVNDRISILDYFDWYYGYNTNEEKVFLLNKMENAAKKHKNKELLLEVEFQRAHSLQRTDNDSLYILCTNALETVIKKARKRNDKCMEIRSLHELYHKSFYEKYDAVSTFLYLDRLAEVLDEIEHIEDTYPYRDYEYYCVGSIFYHFREYEKSTKYLHKSIKISDKKFSIFKKRAFEDSILQKPATYFNPNIPDVKVFDYLASYHFNITKMLDSTEYYNKKIIYFDKKPEYVFKDHYLIALSKLGEVALERKEYDKAIVMFNTVLDVMGEDGDQSFLSSVYIGLAKCYIAMNDLDMVRKNIEKLHKSILSSWHMTQNQDYYSILSSYYAFTGERELSRIYMDSALMMAEKIQQASWTTASTRAKQVMQKMEIDLKASEIKTYKIQLLFVIICLLITTIAIIVILHFYRKKKKAYHSLAERIKNWAIEINENFVYHQKEDQNIENTKEKPTKLDIEIANKVKELMESQELFKDTTLTLDTLAIRMGLHRTLLSHAINSTANKNFKQFINEYRIKEAIKIISNSAKLYNKLYIDEIYEQVGFNSRVSFYRAFKQITGLSPTEFKNNI